MFNRKSATDTQDQQWNNYRGGCGEFGRKLGDKAHRFQDFFHQAGNRKATNIEESDTSFTLSLYAAGLNKSNFKVSATEDILSISYTAPAAAGGAQGNFVHQEYVPASFNRSFQLNGKVLTDNINASYTDGVLKVSLLKNPETNKPAQEVNID